MRVFVYGTLKKGGANHQLLAGKMLEMRSWMEGWDLFNLGPYPCACKGDGRIAVEAYIISPLDLSLLDDLEGYPSLYNRIKAKDITGIEAGCIIWKKPP